VSIALMAAGPLPHLAQPVETRALRGRMRRAKTDREDARWLHELLAEGGYRRSRSSPLTAPGELAPGAAARATRHPQILADHRVLASAGSVGDAYDTRSRSSFSVSFAPV
jgi:hypothetical protein